MIVHMRNYAIAGLLAAALLAVGGFALPNGVAVADDRNLQVMSLPEKPDNPSIASWYQDDDGSWHYWGDPDNDGTSTWVVSAWLQGVDSPDFDGDGASDIPASTDPAPVFWLDANGALAQSRVIDPSKPRDANPAEPDGTSCFYVDQFGQVVKGRTKVGNNFYLANPETGVLETGKKYGILETSLYDGKTCYYFISPSKHCATKSSAAVKVAANYYVLPCGSQAQLFVGGKKAMNPSTAQKKKGIKRLVYLANATGKLEVGNVKVTVNGKKVATSILGTKKYDKDKKGNAEYHRYYIHPTYHCAVVTKAPVYVKRFGWVYPYYNSASSKTFNAGRLITGRKVVGNQVYLAKYSGAYTGKLESGWLNTKYYDSKKVMRKYYVSPKTHSITYGRPMKVSNKFGYVYAPNKNGYLLTSCKKIDSKHMLLVEKNGRIYNKKGWLRTSKYSGYDDRYRLERTSKNKYLVGARIGDFKVNGVKYRGQNNGAVFHDRFMQSGNSYYWVNHDGKYNYDGVVTSLYRRAQGYWSPTHYLIMVDVDNPRTMVFEGYKGHWNVKYIWDCCTGAPWTPTITGTFSIGLKGYSFGEGNGYSCYYWSQISGGYLFHSQLYYAYTWTLMDGSINKRCSHGCVRLYADNARWIWNNAPSGTTVACVY